MKLTLGGSLAWYDPQKRTHLDITLVEPVTLTALLKRLSIPRAEVALIAINGKLYEGDEITLEDSDTLLLYPPIGGGA